MCEGLAPQGAPSSPHAGATGAGSSVGAASRECPDAASIHGGHCTRTASVMRRQCGPAGVARDKRGNIVIRRLVSADRLLSQAPVRVERPHVPWLRTGCGGQQVGGAGQWLPTGLQRSRGEPETLLCLPSATTKQAERARGAGVRLSTQGVRLSTARCDDARCKGCGRCQTTAARPGEAANNKHKCVGTGRYRGRCARRGSGTKK